jgi:carbamoyltransferase
MRILGVSNAHDANVCVVEDGNVLLHVEKERLTRVRYDVGSMEEFLPGILKSIGLSIDDIDAVAGSIPVWNDLPTTGQTTGGEYFHATGWAKGEITVCGKKLPHYNIAHHLGHLSTAFYLSPFDEADVLSIDGGGNFTFGLLCRVRDHKFDLIADLKDQNLGWFWNALAGRIFGSMDAAGKVMGLAPYGKPGFVDLLYKRYGNNADGIRFLKMEEFPDHTKPIEFYDIGVKKEPGVLTEEEKDMACSLQVITNEMAVAILQNYIKPEARSENLCLSGGVALNCVMNEVIRKTGMYQNIYVPSAPNDAGLSMGFALYLWHNILGNEKKSHSWQPYRGIPHGTDELLQAVEKARQHHLKISHIPLEEEQNLAVVDLILKQKIVGVHRGRSESGPRALGHRSIIADPRDPKMKDIINAKVKFREAFRPFAPSVLIDEVRNYIDFDGLSPYMSFAPSCNGKAHAVMAAAIHVDSTARLQTVDPANNPDFYRLIKAFHDKTGLPAVLNTSLNTRGEPINETPLHSIGTLLKSDMDALLIDEYLFEKL